MMRWEEFRVRTSPMLAAAGLFVSLIGFWILATALFAAARYLGFKWPWAALLYTLSQLAGFLTLLRITRLEGGGFGSMWFGGGGPRDFAYAMAFLLVAWVLWGATTALGEALGIPQKKWWEEWGVRTPVDVIPIAVFALAAAFFEEVFYRGYGITRLYTLTGRMWVAAIVSIALFTIIHLPFGPQVMLNILGWGTVDTLLFLHRRSTKASFYYHFVNNAIVYVAFPLLGLWAKPP